MKLAQLIAFLAGWLILPVNAIAQQPQQAAPVLMPCGNHGPIDVYCGTIEPEDLERSPDGKFLIATQYRNEGRPGTPGAGMALFDLKTKTFRKMTESVQPDKGWGEAACPGPIGDALISHGSSLAKRRDGKWALYVVNHGGRQSIEMFELTPAAGGWTIVWHGCEIAQHVYNDVAILPDGGFVGTYPSVPGGMGYVARWTPGKGESEAPGSRMRLPNGVVVSADGRYMFVNEFGAKAIHKIDLNDGSRHGSAQVDFLPDNLTWSKDGRLLVAGIKGARGDCPQGSGRRCIDGFGVAEIDPSHMAARPLFDSSSVEPLMSGVSVALRVGSAIYLGAYLGDRITRIPYTSKVGR